jgi:hypothetical protein
MTAQERFDAASVNLNTALAAVLNKVKAYGALDGVEAELSQAKAALAQAETDKAALAAAHEDALNRVSAWAENALTTIKTIVPTIA